MSPEERQAAQQFAAKLGVTIPDTISIHLWSLPLLEAMLRRIEELEMRQAGYQPKEIKRG